MKIKRATFRHIESEIYEYKNTKKLLSEMIKDLQNGLEAVSYDTISAKTTYKESSTEARATKLADWILLREMERITTAIFHSFLQTRQEIQHAVWVKYGLEVERWNPPKKLQVLMMGKNRHDLTPGDMAGILNIDESTFHRYRTGFVLDIAERLGWY